MDLIDKQCTIEITIPNESPSSPTMEDAASKRTAAVIPVYAVSDSDEDRANAFMKNMSASLMSETNRMDEGAGCSHDPDIMETGHVVDISNGQSIEETASVQIMFMNTDIGRKYRHDIEEFFHTLMTTENLSKDHEPLPRIQRRPNLKESEGEGADSSVVQETTVIGTISVYRCYMMDKLGWPMIANMLNQTPGISIPDYIQIFAETYPPPEDARILETKPIKTSKKCFNCGEDGHEAGKCPKPFDKRTFNRNRAKFLATGLQYGRYHKEEKNKKMKPGELSDSLKGALGLLEEELPQHIYRMRQLGYPPGWLLHAEATNSGLAMFDKHGKEVDLDGDCMEDGEVADHRLRDEANLKYNSEHLIMYPGFNVGCPEGVQDRALTARGYPVMKPEHSLNVMSSNINLITQEQTAGPDQSQKRARYDSSSRGHKRFKSDIDMELSDGEEEAGSPCIEIIEIPQPPPDDDDDSTEIRYEVIDELPPEHLSPVPKTSTSGGGTVSNINDTLNALEVEKQKLLAELNEMEGNMITSTPGNAAALAGSSSMDAPPVLQLDDDGDLVETTPQPLYQSMSYLVTTPVIQHSGIEKLPSYDRFSDGITKHLPYENLPNATGVYQKMSGVIKDVKEKMANIRPKRTGNK